MVRAELHCLLGDARAGRLRGRRLYVFRLDRLRRSGIADTLPTLDELRGGGVEIVSVADGPAPPPDRTTPDESMSSWPPPRKLPEPLQETEVEQRGIERSSPYAPSVVNRRVDDADQATQDDERRRGVSASPAATDDAIRLAAKVAIDAGDYEGARALLELLQARPNRSASVVKLRRWMGARHGSALQAVPPASPRRTLAAVKVTPSMILGVSALRLCASMSPGPSPMQESQRFPTGGAERRRQT
jgi:Resolvase, N terminal domain